MRINFGEVTPFNAKAAGKPILKKSSLLTLLTTVIWKVVGVEKVWMGLVAETRGRMRAVWVVIVRRRRTRWEEGGRGEKEKEDEEGEEGEEKEEESTVID